MSFIVWNTLVPEVFEIILWGAKIEPWRGEMRGAFKCWAESRRKRLILQLDFCTSDDYLENLWDQSTSGMGMFLKRIEVALGKNTLWTRVAQKWAPPLSARLSWFLPGVGSIFLRQVPLSDLSQQKISQCNISHVVAVHDSTILWIPHPNALILKQSIEFPPTQGQRAHTISVVPDISPGRPGDLYLGQAVSMMVFSPFAETNFSIQIGGCWICCTQCRFKKGEHSMTL